MGRPKLWIPFRYQFKAMKKINIVETLVNTLEKHGINVSPRFVYSVVLAVVLVIMILCMLGIIDTSVQERMFALFNFTCPDDVDGVLMAMC